MIDIAIIPHPFSAERIRHTMEAGKSVAGIIRDLQPDAVLAKYAHVYLNGDYIPQKKWEAVRPKAGTSVSIRMVPMGGGGGGGAKNALSSVLSIAVMAVAPQFIPAGLGFMGLNVSGILTSGVNLLTRLALGALAPPPKASLSAPKESQTLFIQGARNQISPFARVPKVLGRHRFVPPLGAQPYTETVGNDQYLRMLFVWGYGPLEISDLKIGETPLAAFSDVEIETRQGYITDAPLTLYSNSVLQNNMQVVLTAAGGYVIRTTDADANEISVDITLPRGLVAFDASGNKVSTAVQLTVDYAVAGSGSWVSAGTLDIAAKQGAAVRRGLRFTVPRGTYNVRLKRVTADNIDANIFNETVWTALRTIRYTQPVTMKGIAMTVIRIKATDQLNGVLDRFNGVVHSILPDWNGSAWVERVTSNPAAIFRHVLQGTANARPLADSRLDLVKIQDWHVNCAAAGREFNAVIDYNASVRDVMQGVAATGRASPTLIDGKWAVVEDKPQTVPVQHFTPRNTFNFKGEKAFADMPHALRIRFINRDRGWLQDERLVFDDGFDATTATKYETLELPGVTSADHAWRDARYHIATARLRPETYSFYADVEHIVCTRGDLIRFTHDVPLFGLMSGRVRALTTSAGNTTAVTLDAGLPMEAGKSYAVRFRLSDGSSFVAPVITTAGTVLTLTFLTPVATASGPAVGDLALFGVSGQESVELIVRSIEPQNDLSARITCVDAHPAIHTASIAPLPAFTSVLTAPQEMQRPPLPVISQIQSGLESAIRHVDGSFTSRIVITLSPPSFGRVLTVRAMIRATDETDFRLAEIMAQGGNRVSITDAAEGETYDIQLRYVTNDGALSAVTVISGYRVEGTTALPSDVTGLNMNILDSTAYLSWMAVTDIDLAYYTLRYAPQISGVTWGSATDLVTRISADATSITVPAAVGTYLLKAVDVGGRQSANADTVISTIAGLAGFNAVLTLTEDTAFNGAKVKTGVNGTSLRLSGADSVDDWGNLDVVSDCDVGNAGLAALGTYNFANSVDLGAIYTSRLTADMNVLGVDINSLMDVWGDLDQQESWDQAVDPSLWNAQLKLRTTNDNPAGSPVWSDWMPFVVGDYAARAYQFQAALTGGAPTVTPTISRLRVNIDMPDRTASARNITSATGGSNILFVKPFNASPAISITAQNMATGDYYSITAISAAGFTIRFFNTAGTGIARTFDYLAKGYGEQA